MHERHEHLPCPASMLSDVVLDRRVPAVEVVLVPQTLVDALGGVALLPRQVEIVTQDPVYDLGEPLQLRTPPRTTHAVSRRHRVLQHLAHGISVHSEYPRGFPDTHAVYHAGSSDA